MGRAREKNQDREVIDQDLYEWGEYPLLEQMPGYLAPIAIDAGVSLSKLVQMDYELQKLDATGQGGTAKADKLANRIGDVIDELREQVRNANRDQINEYMARREEWIEAQ